jgi:hypothetical protein
LADADPKGSLPIQTPSATATEQPEVQPQEPFHANGTLLQEVSPRTHSTHGTKIQHADTLVTQKYSKKRRTEKGELPLKKKIKKTENAL